MFFITCFLSPEVHPSKPSSKNYSCDLWLLVVTCLVYMKMKSLSSVRLWPHGLVHQAPLVGFSRQEYWSALPSSPGDLPNPGNEPGSPALQTDTLPSEPPGKSRFIWGSSSSLKCQGRSSVFSGENGITKGIQASPSHNTVFISQGQWDSQHLRKPPCQFFSCYFFVWSWFY